MNCFTSHIEKIFCSISDLKSAQLIALDIKKYDDKNINTRKILSFLSIKLMLSECISIANDLQLVKMIIFAQVEWYLYINMQIRQIYKALHMVKQNNSCVLLSHIAYFDRLAHYLSSYLSTMNVNLKSVKCATYQYFGSTIYLNGICCTAVHKYNCYYEPSKQTVANLIRKLKSKLYHKNNKGYWRANTYIRPLKALLSMEKILQSWLAYYSSALSNQQVLKINRIADYVFYKWQTK